MAHINLLPWRENLRAQKQREFGVMLLVFVILTGVGLYGWYQSIFSSPQLKGWGSRVRTCNQRIQSPLLYQLSYSPINLVSSFNACSGVPVSWAPFVQLFNEWNKTLYIGTGGGTRTPKPCGAWT